MLVGWFLAGHRAVRALGESMPLCPTTPLAPLPGSALSAHRSLVMLYQVARPFTGVIVVLDLKWSGI